MSLLGPQTRSVRAEHFSVTFCLARCCCPWHHVTRFLQRWGPRYALVRLTLVSLVPNEAQSAQSALLPRLRLKRHADDVSHLQRKQSDDIIVGGALRGALCPFVWSFLQLCAFCLELLGDLLRGPDAPDLVKVACAQALHFIRACRASSSAVVPAFEKAKKPALAMCEVSEGLYFLPSVSCRMRAGGSNECE